METLPQELINCIVLFAERYPNQHKYYYAIHQSYERGKARSQFPRLAILNRAWKEAVEYITFRRLHISTENDLENFHEIVTGNRRKYVSQISFTERSPEYSESRYTLPEASRRNQNKYNENFTTKLEDLEEILRKWKDDGLQNVLRLDSPLAFRKPEPRKSEPGSFYRRSCAADGFHRGLLQEPWLLRITHPNNLPTLSSIQHLTVEDGEQRLLAPSTGPNLAFSLPNLQTVDWKFQDFYGSDEEESDLGPLYHLKYANARKSKVRCAARAGFARSLMRASFHRLKSAEITLEHARPFDQRLPVRSIVPHDLPHYPFSTAIRTFSENLTSLTLSAHVDSTLFWPLEEPATLPSWPNLTTLDITISLVTPSGELYFTGSLSRLHPDDDDPADGTIGDLVPGKRNYSNFRIRPDLGTCNPFLAALSKAALQMPVLGSLMLTIELQSDDGNSHIAYYAPGQESDWCDEDDGDEGKRRVYYDVDVRYWRPKYETAARLRKVGEERFGGEVVERFIRGYI